MFDTVIDTFMPGKTVKLGPYRHGLLMFKPPQDDEYRYYFKNSTVELITRGGKTLTNIYSSREQANESLKAYGGSMSLGRPFLYMHPKATMEPEDSDGVDWSGYIIKRDTDRQFITAMCEEPQVIYTPDDQGLAVFIDGGYAHQVIIGAPFERLKVDGSASTGLMRLVHVSQDGRTLWHGRFPAINQQRFVEIGDSYGVKPSYVKKTISGKFVRKSDDPESDDYDKCEITVTDDPAVNLPWDRVLTSTGPDPSTSAGGSIEFKGGVLGDLCPHFGQTEPFAPEAQEAVVTPPSPFTHTHQDYYESVIDMHVSAAGIPSYLKYRLVEADDIVNKYGATFSGIDSGFRVVYDPPYERCGYAHGRRSYSSYDHSDFTGKIESIFSGWGGESRVTLLFNRTEWNGRSVLDTSDPELTPYDRRSQGGTGSLTIRIGGSTVKTIDLSDYSEIWEGSFAELHWPEVMGNSAWLQWGVMYAPRHVDIVGKIGYTLRVSSYTYGSSGFYSPCILITEGILDRDSKNLPYIRTLTSQNLYMGGLFARGKYYPGMARTLTGERLTKRLWCAYDPLTDSISAVYDHPILYQ